MPRGRFSSPRWRGHYHHTRLWAVLQYKVHHPEEFGNLPSKAEIISDKDDVMIRNIVLNLPGSKTKTYQEEITSYGNSWVSLRKIVSSC